MPSRQNVPSGEGAKRRKDVRLRVRTNSGVEVPIGQQHWPVRRGRQLRRREAGWGAAGSERPVHKQNHVELDSARCIGDKVWSPKNLADDPKAGARAQNKSIPATSRQTSMDTQAREPRETAVRSPDGQRPDRARSGAPSDRTALRARVRKAELRVSVWERCKDALRRVDELLRSGYHWVVDADLKSYFDSIPHEGLMERVGEKIADCRVLSLIRGMLQAGVMDRMKGWQATEQGSPQGAGISPLLSNIYLNGVDWKMARKGFEMVR